MENQFYIPPSFTLSRRCPSIQELQALWTWLDTNYKDKIKSVLEFGCGVTSWVLHNTIKHEKYVIVEQFQPCIETVKKHVSNIEIVDFWDKIPANKYDLLFVDASTGAPAGLKPRASTNRVPFRDDAIDYVKDMLHQNSIVIIHDWQHRHYNWRVHRRYLEDNGYKCIWSCPIGYGFGAYIKG
jgi:hypothetical protein